MEQLISGKLEDRKLIIASSSEPYVHYFEGEEMMWRKGTGGVVAALDPVMRSHDGIWIANASGSADREAADKEGKLRVPPDGEKYVLKRVFLSKREQQAFLSGVSNGAIWPLSHVVYVRPRFVDEEWETFKQVSRKFADAIAAEASKQESVIWLNDYHMVLAAKYLKEQLPDASTAFFWHIPWPNPQVFKICPWHEEILDAMLSNDLIGFHTRYYSNNFLDSVDQTLETRIDRPASSVFYKNREVIVRAAPISVDSGGILNSIERAGDAALKRLRKKYGLRKESVIVGVDRLDYIKGLPEKVKAVDKYLQKHPESAELVTFIQLASPTRIHLPEYNSYAEELESLVEEVNWKHSTDKWKPVILDVRYASTDEIFALYRLAEVCLVASLHDGMNLVSKEYVSAKADGNGVLILSKFAGAAAEMGDALMINPYSVTDIVAALEAAMQMPLEDRQARMRRMQAEIRENDVFGWASGFLEKAAKLRAKAT